MLQTLQFTASLVLIFHILPLLSSSPSSPSSCEDEYSWTHCAAPRRRRRLKEIDMGFGPCVITTKTDGAEAAALLLLLLILWLRGYHCHLLLTRTMMMQPLGVN